MVRELEPGGGPTPASRVRATLAPLAWLGVTVVAASVLALPLRLVVPGAPAAGGWNPTWSYAEVLVEGLDGPSAARLADELRPMLAAGSVTHRADADGAWITYTGPADRLELLGELREALGPRASGRVAFGSNLLRALTRLGSDPAAAADAARSLLPAALYGGSLVLLAAGWLLHRRLHARRPPPPRPERSLPRELLLGLALGLALAVLVEGVSLVLAWLDHPIAEQPWVLELFERGGPALLALLPMIVLVAPLAEEVFFRGYLLEALAPPLGWTGAIAVSSAAFAAVHGHGPALPAYLAYGLGLGLAARYGGSLRICVVAHVTVNALGVARLAWGAG